MLLSIGTALFSNLYERYAVIGPELLQNTGFDNHLAQWTHTTYGISVSPTEEGIVHLQSDDPGKIVHITQIIPNKHYPLLRLSCDTKAHNATQGQARWMTARVVLIAHEPDGTPMRHLPHALVGLRGIHDWEHHQGVFAIPDNAAQIRVSIQLPLATGNLWIKNPSLRPVVEKDSFHAFRKAAVLTWAMCLAWITIPLMRLSFRQKNRMAVVALGVVIAAGTLIPDKLKEQIGSAIFPGLTIHAGTPLEPKFRFTLPQLIPLDVYKAGHFVLFALLAVAAIFKKPYPLQSARILAYLALFALATEVMQVLAVGRNPQLGDLIIDGAGIAFGLLLLKSVQILKK